VLGQANEVVLVDLTPEALITRLREGKVYPAEHVPTALQRFFRIENLATLREVALRQTAEEVESKRVAVPEPLGTREDLVIDDSAQAVGERVLALVTPRPRSQRLVRRAWRSAQRLGAELDLLYVRRPGSAPSDEEREQIEALRRLASVLGATLHVEEADDIADAAAGLAKERGITYVLVGQPDQVRGIARLRESLAERLMRTLPGVDVRIVADRSKLREGAP
jgi:two-component system sensor histidine kinase KdpD